MTLGLSAGHRGKIAKDAKELEEGLSMNPSAGEFFPGRRPRPQPINTNMPAAPFLRSNFGPPAHNTQSAPVQGPAGMGLGINIQGGDASQHANGASTAPVHGIPYNYHAPQTASGGGPINAATYPLPQHEFGGARDVSNQPRVYQANNQHLYPNLNSQSSEIFSAHGSTVPSPYSTAQFSAYSDTEETNYSTISPHYLITMPELANSETPVFQQRSHPHGFKRVIMAGDIEVREAFPGAYDTVKGLNADFFAMPYGTRVINIKTDFSSNIHFAVRQGVWSTLEAVSKRIMHVWESREHRSEKVLFLFAINGTKQFCGVAEMSGPWDPQGQVDGWVEGTNGAGNVGSIPLTWVYIKNVPYSQFLSVKQERNGQPVINMWNGMHLDSDAGRKVIEVFVTSPHFTNVLAWEKRDQENHTPRVSSFGWGNRNRQNAPDAGNEPVHNVRAIRGGRGGQAARGSYAGRREVNPMACDNWRRPHNEPQGPGRVIGEVKDSDTTPKAARYNGTGVNTNALPSSFDGAAETSDAPRPGQVYQCFVDEHGNFVPISPHLQRSTQCFTTNTGGNPSMNNLREQRGQNASAIRGARSFNDRGVWGPSPVETLGGDRDDDPYQQHNLRHAASSASMRPPQASMPNTAGGPVLHHTTSTASFAPQMQQDHPLRHAASAASFVPQMHSGIPHYVPMATVASESDDSYPSFFKAADSMAGYNPRYKPTPKRDVQATPTHAPRIDDALKHQCMTEWARKTPTHPASSFAYPMPVDAAAVPSRNLASYYHLMADRADVQTKIRSLGATDDAEYFRLMAKQTEICNMLSRLMVDDDGFSHVHSDGPPCKNRVRGESEADSTAQGTPSVEKYNVSPLKARDGRVLPSISKKGSPPSGLTRKGIRDRNAPYNNSIDAMIVASVHNLVKSDTSSVNVVHHTSPPAESVASGTAESETTEVTNPFSEGDGSGSGGGIRLDS